MATITSEDQSSARVVMNAGNGKLVRSKNGNAPKTTMPAVATAAA